MSATSALGRVTGSDASERTRVVDSGKAEVNPSVTVGVLVAVDEADDCAPVSAFSVKDAKARGGGCWAARMVMGGEGGGVGSRRWGTRGRW